MALLPAQKQALSAALQQVCTALQIPTAGQLDAATLNIVHGFILGWGLALDWRESDIKALLRAATYDVASIILADKE